ncbi:septum site-determining protein Ssd [Kineococcus terrestris]|uniref:septum site-determining protein Ssd n=1 Tax=Kineococcus terrestris TaxID=2044856 RepID=UPI0034DB1678
MTPARHPRPGGPPPAREAVLLTRDEALAAAVTRLAGAAGCPVRRVPDSPGGPDVPGGPGVPAALVLAGADAGAAQVAAARAGGADVVVVGTAPAAASWWRAVTELGADHAALLPEAEDWLLDRLAEAAAGRGAPGRVVGVVGGTGGAGASVVAAALALAAAGRGHGTLLLDADPVSGGLDLLLGADELPGLRWGDLAGVSGRLRPDVLLGAVEVTADLHLLAADRHRPAAPLDAALPSVLDAARRGFDLTVLDLPRAAPLAAEAAAGCEELLVVVPGTARGAAAACAVVDALAPGAGTSVALVGRAAPAGAAGLDADTLAEVVGAPVSAWLRTERDLDVSVERGEGLPRGRRSPLAAFADRWARGLAPDGVPSRRAVPVSR